MNSLALVQAILALQRRSNSSSEETKTQLKMASNRVLAIATVHKQLHLTGSLEEVEVDTFLQRLCENLKHTAPAEIAAINIAADPMKLRSVMASGIGLLVAELVTNSSKYAYQAGQSGNVNVQFKRSPTGCWKSPTKAKGCLRASISIRARALECKS